MKKTMKIIGIIALVAVIGFSMIACDDGGGARGGSPYGPTGGGQTGYNSGNGWPSSSVRSSYGIGGMNQPPGSGFRWVTIGADPSGTWSSVLEIYFTEASNTSSYISNWFSSNGWSGDFSYDYGMGQWEKGSQTGIHSGSMLFMYNNLRN